MGNLAYVLDKLGVKEANINNGEVQFSHDGSTIDHNLMNNLCHHVSILCREDLTEKEEEDVDPDFYFSI
jgi:hypothetical protein